MSKLERYENTLNELRKGLLEKLKDRIKSIVLYGSVARKEASEESDVDIFVVLKDNSLYRKVSDIAYKVDLKNGAATPIFWTTPEELAKYAIYGSPLLEMWLKKVLFYMTMEHLQEFAKASLRRADKALLAAKSLLEKNLLGDSISRAYM
jgi:predicted nucleotidyltransferase